MKKDKLILAIDTAIGQGSISLLNDEGVIDFCLGKSQNSRSTDLLQEISELLRKCGVQKRDIKMIAVSTGPGSFTGARIGIATAIGYAYAIDCACYGITILEAMAYSFAPEKSSLTVLPTGRGKSYFQNFNFKNGVICAQTEISAGDCESLALQIRKSAPSIIIAQKVVIEETNEYSQILDMGIKVEFISENVSDYIGRYCRTNEIRYQTLNRNLTPIYVDQKSIKN